MPIKLGRKLIGVLIGGDWGQILIRRLCALALKICSRHQALRIICLAKLKFLISII